MDIEVVKRALGNLPGLQVDQNGRLTRVLWRDTDGSTQRIMIEELGMGAVLLAGICAEQQLDPRRALRAAGTLTAGSIALVDGFFVLRTYLPAHDELTALVPQTAAEAKRLRGSLVQVATAQVTQAFEHYEA
jgi:hypothetical protein